MDVEQQTPAANIHDQIRRQASQDSLGETIQHDHKISEIPSTRTPKSHTQKNDMATYGLVFFARIEVGYKDVMTFLIDAVLLFGK